VIHGVFAAVACAAALVFATNLPRLHERGDGTSASDPQKRVDRGSWIESPAMHLASVSRDEPLACFASTTSTRSEPETTSDAPSAESFAQSSHVVSRALCEP
jgi:hypothetical protein